jgi:hypothetical protein
VLVRRYRCSSWHYRPVALNWLIPCPLITHAACLNFDFAILNLFEPSAPWSDHSDGPEVEHGAHFLVLYYPRS